MLGWQFAAGEYIQTSRDVFGDEGIYDVVTRPNLQAPANAAAGEAAGNAARGSRRADTRKQHVAVFSE